MPSPGRYNLLNGILGFSPDGGDGPMEILVLVVLVALVVLGAFRLATK